MFRLFSSIALLLVLAVCALGSDAPASAPIDRHLFDTATVVVRARVLEGAEGSKYLSVKIEVLSVLKASSGLKLPSSLRIAYYSFAQGLPTGIATLYLIPYDPDKPESGWKLLEEWDEKSKVYRKGYSHHVED